WARDTGRLGGVAEFVQERTSGWRVVDAMPVVITVGVVVQRISAPFPHQLRDGRIQNRVRFLAASDGQWYELPQDTYLKATGAPSSDSFGKAIIAAGALIGAIIVAGEASKGR